MAVSNVLGAGVEEQAFLRGYDPDLELAKRKPERWEWNGAHAAPKIAEHQVILPQSSGPKVLVALVGGFIYGCTESTSLSHQRCRLFVLHRSAGFGDGFNALLARARSRTEEIETVHRMAELANVVNGDQVSIELDKEGRIMAVEMAVRTHLPAGSDRPLSRGRLTSAHLALRALPVPFEISLDIFPHF
ncbi:hypothetical protein BS47DRAFT_1389600 [Hydnum rufescens UP504]|uniref:Uncharacterized protein n=1 Tax=Hydnum rufescens UP504 TaxID=1448309 RepID=A0A9P6B572_9AGAM|nr:hypothetical protein BS47DRAFT_1389600 [Hydnum rufescens UP504]